MEKFFNTKSPIIREENLCLLKNEKPRISRHAILTTKCKRPFFPIHHSETPMSILGPAEKPPTPHKKRKKGINMV